MPVHPSCIAFLSLLYSGFSTEMPLHKSTRAPRLDPTMISAPLGDFRHTMHIGRGGDAFGDTSFLSTLGPSSASADLGSAEKDQAAGPEGAANHSSLHPDDLDGSQSDELQHSESVSSFTLDLDLDLGPSMLGDVLGVMDETTRNEITVNMSHSKSDNVSLSGLDQITCLPTSVGFYFCILSELQQIFPLGCGTVLMPKGKDNHGIIKSQSAVYFCIFYFACTMLFYFMS
uniref:CDC42 effector protein (Rho GTPase binding) 5 n=1 Tax=Salarias fasciatus TaxID=181472 RepID=A0A672HSK9_SALFA